MKNQGTTGFRLIGIELPQKTTNKDGQSGTDCGNLWQQFEKEQVFSRIEGRENDKVYAVYHNYEGDYMQPFSYFIGCKVSIDAVVPEGLSELHIPKGTYAEFTAKGVMPVCIADAWKTIWASDIQRAYSYDFEVYDERSADWNNAEVDLFISVH